MTPDKKKAQPQLVSPRIVRRGDLVEVDEIEGSQVVRDIVVVLYLGNGTQRQYQVDEKVKRLPPEDLSEIVAEIESAPTE